MCPKKVLVLLRFRGLKIRHKSPVSHCVLRIQCMQCALYHLATAYEYLRECDSVVFGLKCAVHANQYSGMYTRPEIHLAIIRIAPSMFSCLMTIACFQHHDGS